MTRNPSADPANAQARAHKTDRLLDELGYWLNRHDIERVKAFYAPEYEGSDAGCASSHRGPAGAAECFARYWGAFPDLRIVAGERVVEGNQVAVSWRARGTHDGTFMNIPATGRRITLRGVSFFTLDGDRVARANHTWDVAGFLRAVRLLPDL